MPHEREDINEAKPAWKRLLQGDDAKTAAELQEQLEVAGEFFQFGKAVQLREKLLALREAAQGADHWETGNERWALCAVRKLAALTVEQQARWRNAVRGAESGLSYSSSGRYEQAHPLLLEYHAQCKDIFGERHPNTACSYNNLASNLKGLGRFSEAAPLFRRALDLNLELLGENHPHAAYTYLTLASHLAAQGQHSKSQPLYQSALDTSVAVLGENHLDTARAWNGLASNLNALGRPAEAEALYHEALNIRLKLVGEHHPDTANSYNNVAHNASDLGRFAEAERLYRKALDLRVELFGERNSLTAHSYGELAGSLDSQGRYAEAEPLFRKSLQLHRELLGESHPDTADSCNGLAMNLRFQGRYTEAQPLFEKALELDRELLGEKHPKTARSYNNLGMILKDQARCADAEPLLRKALELNLELLGDEHRDTALSSNNLADIFVAQGRYEEALPLLRMALEVYRDLGDSHPETVMCCSNLAWIYAYQGRYVDADPVFWKVLELRLHALGERHHDTADSYSSVGFNLAADGRLADATKFFQKSVEIYRELFGEKHPRTALGYTNLGHSLTLQGRYFEAEELLRHSLDLRLELLGEAHNDTADSYSNLAVNLNAQGKYGAAQQYLTKAHSIYRKVVGERHPLTAMAYHNLGSNLGDQGKYAEAEQVLREALDLTKEAHGERHPNTASCYQNLAVNLGLHGKFAEAHRLFKTGLQLSRELLGESHWQTAACYCNLGWALAANGAHSEAAQQLTKAAISYEAARLNIADRGLDRAVFGIDASPYSLLAAMLARLDAPARAWAAAETDLARGISDESASRRGVSAIAGEQDQHSASVARLNQIRALVRDLVLNGSPSPDDNLKLIRLQDERRVLEAQLSDYATARSLREVATLTEVQAAIQADTAMVLWIDVDVCNTLEEHWACIVRSTGDPIWQRLPGSGPANTWSIDDAALPRELVQTVATHGSPAEIAGLADKLYAQRIAPLETHLSGVNRLYVVPVYAMAGVPVEILTDQYTVSYVPSGTYLARVVDRTPAHDTSLLVIGETIFPPAESDDFPLPSIGLLITQVLPGSNAANACLRAGDVLLRYAGTELASLERFDELIENHADDGSIAVNLWRKGIIADCCLMPGRLGIVVDSRPAAEVIMANRSIEKLLSTLARGGDWTELPGSAIEVARLVKIVGRKRTTAITGSAANKRMLERLRAKGRLARFRYIHFATHGDPNNARSFESAIILSRGDNPIDTPLNIAAHDDVRLTANDVLEKWKLRADLVTLSACESALGRPGGGDGLLGFAQAFILAGAKSVCLSLWKVDDTATVLFMERFYQNLLGKRPGVSRPMAKSEALAEAKRWLRDLTRDQAYRFTHDMANDVGRGKGTNATGFGISAADLPGMNSTDDRPFSHPRYWAAFILIGAPD